MKFWKPFFLLFSFLTVMLLLVGCDLLNPKTTSSTTITSGNYYINLPYSNSEITLLKGEEKQIEFETNDPNGVTFTSSDESIVTVDSTGKLSGIAIGNGTITLTSKSDNLLTLTISVDVFGVKPKYISIKGNDVVEVGSQVEFSIISNPLDAYNEVLWSSDKPEIATVDENGVVKGISGGVAKITATSKIDGKITAKKNITVENIFITFASIKTPVIVGDKIQLDATTSSKLPWEVIFTSNDEELGTIDANNVLSVLKEGALTITAKLKELPTMKTSITINILESYNPDELLDYLAAQLVLSPNFYQLRAYGWTHEYDFETYNSVANYYFGDIPIIESLIPESRSNRPGKMPALSSSLPKYNDDNIYWVIVHDTGDTQATATAAAMSSYVNNDAETSWHYTVDENEIYQHLPDNERAYHAGDGSRSPGLTDTGVKATGPNPTITISDDTYYVLNDVKSTVKAPGNYPITPAGIYTYIGGNGNYYINNTYYNPGFGFISNAGGNYNGIGIEMSINEGSDIFRSWQRTAKLAASLLVKHNLPLENLMFHQNFSGKMCPQTMLRGEIADLFKQMVAVEYHIMKNFPDAEISMTSLTPEYLDNQGRIIKKPTNDVELSYKITVTLNGLTESRVFKVMLPVINK